MAKTTELDALYKATTYQVYLPGGVVRLRLGQPCPVLAGWMEENGCRKFAIVTAYNPGSQKLDPTLNAERQAQLECDLLEGNYEPYAGENLADDSAWLAEETCFIPDIAPEDACALGEEYGQNAVVVGGSDAVAHLLWIEATAQ